MIYDLWGRSWNEGLKFLGAKKSKASVDWAEYVNQGMKKVGL